VAAWPDLPEPIKAGIMAMVRAASSAFAQSENACPKGTDKTDNSHRRDQKEGRR
jgi:hypothetical protein